MGNDIAFVAYLVFGSFGLVILWLLMWPPLKCLLKYAFACLIVVFFFAEDSFSRWSDFWQEL